MAQDRNSAASLGPNAWLVDEKYEEFLADPTSVGESWREFFADYRPGPSSRPGDTGSVPVVRVPAPTVPTVPTAPVVSPPVPAAQADDGSEPLRGAAARVVENMEVSLGVPTATSYREVPTKLLEINRKIVNNHLQRTRGGKISFTHLIGYAMVRAIADAVPAMNATFVDGADGKPRIIRHEHVGLGLAVDVEKSGGRRSLLVPVIRDADTMDFAAFWTAYDDLIRKVHNNKLTPDDFAGATVSLTNPGTIGTAQSVPRLMSGQGLIVGVGALGYPASFAGSDPAMIADLGVSKVMTISSTYDHRIIQGAESGLFLKQLAELLTGEHDFYVDVFHSLGIPYESVRWRRDENPIDRVSAQVAKQLEVNTLVNMYRVRGHLIADLDPLAAKEPHMHSELDPATYGLTIWDLDRTFLSGGVAGTHEMVLDDLLHVLRNAYCRTIGIEYMHISKPEEKQWIQQRVEGVPLETSPEDQRHILDRLNAAEAFESFLGKRYIGQKRFGLEGGESAIAILDELLNLAADDSHTGVVMGMAHRGRLNVLANIVGKSYDQIFKEFEGHIDPDSTQGSGDVKYHLGQSGKFTSRKGATIPVELAANPSHLEAVDPVVEGLVRARQDLVDDPEAFSVLPVLIHGDAAFAGQGVVAETLNLSTIKGYRVGGTIHVIINNQLGFTTPPDAARSSEYCTDIAKMVQAPIFHVNGDDPEACVHVARLAYAYRAEFHKDVVIDMVCYRRHGHNEGDDPSYTQPLMYKRIDARRSVRKLYTETLMKRGDISLDEAEKALDDFQAKLQTALDETRSSAPPDGIVAKQPPKPVGVLPPVPTGVDVAVLEQIYDVMSHPPADFTVHPKLARQFAKRDEMFAAGTVDWALAESLAFGSLLVEGTPVRLAGQDTRRGTFSQRHSVLVDYETGAEWMPLKNLGADQAKCWIYDSLLSEYAALGFEYGYSVASPEALVVWEAQFGDFVNGATTIVDEYLVAADDKWQQQSGLVLLLPHGYEGQGPDHSSARIERFLILCAEDNIQVANATTSAQYFHLLRRQMRRAVRKPLVVFSPKSLLRAKVAHSPVAELTVGSFSEVLDDPRYVGVDRSGVQRVLVCSGKIAHELMAARDANASEVAVVRVEQLYPWPADQLAEVIASYPSARQVRWVQEEPENMGAWTFVRGRLAELCGANLELNHVTRPESGSPATGSHAIHVQEQDQIVRTALG